jgi:hypothetical protein
MGLGLLANLIGMPALLSTRRPAADQVDRKTKFLDFQNFD